MTFVIAEAGVNHGGDIGQALLLCNAAKEAGADAVKFQHFNSQRLWGDARIEHLQLSDAEMANVAWHCKGLGLEFLCTPFGIKEVAFLAPLVKRWKVASGCLEKFDLLRAIAATQKPIILSTGMADLARVERAVKALGYPADLTLLHCVSAYPCRIENANLAAMEALRMEYGGAYDVGYSDHTQGITVALAAVARGAAVLEKHLTLDRNAEGPDHKASIEPAEFRIMVDAIRTIEKAIGDGVKAPKPCEEETRRAWYDQR